MGLTSDRTTGTPAIRVNIGGDILRDNIVREVKPYVTVFVRVAAFQFIRAAK
jgi:hypothetical protein